MTAAACFLSATPPSATLPSGTLRSTKITAAAPYPALPLPLPAFPHASCPAAVAPLTEVARATSRPAATDLGATDRNPEPLTPEQDRLLREHLPLVRFVARSLADRLPPHVELEELVSAGMVGLLDAARRFSAAKGVQFRSYAQFRVRGAILDSLRTLDWGPRAVRRQGRALQQARHTLEARLGRPAAESELAEEMGISLAALQTLAGDLRSLEITALNAERSEDSDEELLAFLPADEKENPLLRVLAGEAREKLTAAIDALPERERLIMRLYYFEEMTMRQIGEVLGVVESRVSQIHGETLRRLQTTLGCLRRPPVARPLVRTGAAVRRVA